MIIGNVVAVKLTGVDVAQHEIGPIWAVNRGNSSKLPIQTDRAQKGGARDLIVGNVIAENPAGGGVAHDHVGFAGDAAEIADAHDLPVQPDRAHEGGADVVIVVEVDLQSTRASVAQDHVGFAGDAAEIA